MKLLIATYNRKKLFEIKRILAAFHWQLIDLAGVTPRVVVEENAPTFKGNAMLKARALSRRFPSQVVVADDSGLVVPTLGGRPGIHSSRFSGEKKVDAENIAKLLLLMRNLKGSKRRAYFCCAVAIAHKGRIIKIVEARVYGRIAARPQGRTGFGYDPVFMPRGYTKTFAVLGARVKDSMSHRTKAFLQAGYFIRRRFCR